MFDFSLILRTLGGSLAGILMLVGGCLTAVTQTGCLDDQKRVEAGLAAADKGAQIAERNGVELTGRFQSGGLKGSLTNDVILSAGDLFMEFKTNPLAPVLYKMLEYNHLLLLAAIQSNGNIPIVAK